MWRTVPNDHSDQSQNTLFGIRKYPWIHPRFYSPFWRNKPRHALSLQTGSVGAPKGCFCLFSLCSEGVDEKKNVKSSIFRKKTSKFLSSLPFKTQTIDNQWEYDDASDNKAGEISFQDPIYAYWLKTEYFAKWQESWFLLNLPRIYNSSSIL